MKAKLLIAVLLVGVVPQSFSQLAASHASTVTATKPSMQATGRPVARVNGTVLTDVDLLREEMTIFPYARQHNGAIPKPMEADIRNGAMKMMIFEELVYQEARRRNLTIAPERMQKAERDFQRQFPTQQEFREFLNGEFGGSTARLRAKIKRSLLIEDLLKKEVTDRSTVTATEVQKYYDQNPDRFRVPDSYSIQSISIIPPENANAAQLKEARKKADEALRKAREAKNYEEFGILAERISEDDYRVMMGDHRSVDLAKMPPQVSKAIPSLQPGQVSGLIGLDAGAFTIIRLNAHPPAGMQKFAEVKAALKDELQKKKTEQLRSLLNSKLHNGARIEEL